jgi:hypothetical protein
VTFWANIKPICSLKKCHRILRSLDFSTAFQADDEGSIPFTRSNVFNHLVALVTAGDTLLGCSGDTFSPALFAARIFWRPLNRA